MHLAKHAVYLEKSQANKQEALKDSPPSRSDLFCLTTQIRCKNLNVQGEKPVCKDAGELLLNFRTKQAAWKEHYDRLSNVYYD